MFKKARPAQDAFTFSLGGMSTISAVVAPRAIAVDCPCGSAALWRAKTLLKATIFDVADLAGVSIKTVSRVVNSEPNVRATTQQRVVEAIKRLQYTPNEAARRMRASRTRRTTENSL